MLRRAVWLVYAVLWTAALTTPWPAEASEAVLPEESQFTVGKSLHVCAYALLCALTGWQRFLTPRWRPLLLLALSAHAALTEVAQLYVPHRHGCWEDVALNHIGLYLGVVLAWRWWRE
jgi:VanZ family protein